MNKIWIKTIAVLILSTIVASCGNVESIQSTPTAFVTSTTSPTIPLITTPSMTPYPTTPAEATIEAFDSLCAGAQKISMAEISPNNKWIAALCYNENGKEESPLQIVSLDHSKEWKIYYRGYAKGHTGDRHDGIMPYRWSRDGRFLYTVAGNRGSGCCWIGGKYILLVQLNLETGEQTEIINGTDFGSDLPFSFTISEDERFLLFTPFINQPYDFTVLDLLSGEIRVVNLEKPTPINLELAVMSPYEDIIVLPLFRHIEFNDYVVESILSINLNSNEQKVLVSGLKGSEELYPIRWIDLEHILISNANPFAYHYSFEPPIEYWSLNIHTGERVMVDKP